MAAVAEELVGGVIGGVEEVIACAAVEGVGVGVDAGVQAVVAALAEELIGTALERKLVVLARSCRAR